MIASRIVELTELNDTYFNDIVEIGITYFSKNTFTRDLHSFSIAMYVCKGKKFFG